MTKEVDKLSHAHDILAQRVGELENDMETFKTANGEQHTRLFTKVSKIDVALRGDETGQVPGLISTTNGMAEAVSRVEAHMTKKMPWGKIAIAFITAMGVVVAAYITSR